jgi:hypothetical protein
MTWELLVPFDTGELRCWPFTSCTSRELELRWYDYSSDLHARRTPDSPLVRVIELGFWPTAVTPVDERYLLVAGKTDEGRTVIQRLELGVPRYRGDGPDQSVELETPAVLSRCTVYSDGEGGRGLVQAMFRNRGKSGAAFVQFTDSMDVYELDWARDPFQVRRVLEAERHPGLDCIWFDMFHAGDHRTQGYFYWMRGSLERSVHMPGHCSVALFDADRDGIIDEVVSQGQLCKDSIPANASRSKRCREENGVQYDRLGQRPTR